MNITKQQLFYFLHCGGQEATWEEFELSLACPGLPSDEADITEDLFNFLKNADIKAVLVDADSIDGDRVIDAAQEIEQLIKTGHTMIYWFGPNTEVLIAGVNQEEIEID